MRRPLAVQMWSVREEAAKDPAGVLRAIRDMGYEGVEVFGRYGLPARDYRQIIDDLGLRICGVHAPFPAGQAARQILDEQRELGAPIVAWSLEPDEFATADTVARGVERINEGAANARAYGMRIAYHNHWAEFATLPDGRLAYQVLLDLLDPEVLVELDIYWTRLAGADPARVARDLGDRLRLMHVKDGPATTPDAPMVAVGQGSLDIPAALAANPAVRWHIVELDRCATDMLDALRASHAYLTAGIPG